MTQHNSIDDDILRLAEPVYLGADGRRDAIVIVPAHGTQGPGEVSDALHMERLSLYGRQAMSQTIRFPERAVVGTYDFRDSPHHEYNW